MKLVQRLYLKEFFTLLAILSLGFSVVFSILDLIDKMGGFLPGRPTLAALASYALLNVPRFFIYLLPMSVLISSLFIFSQAARRREITAVKAAGGRLRTLLLPFATAGAFLSLAAFVTGEFISPDLSGRAMSLRSHLEGKGKRLLTSDGSLWLKTRDGSPVKIDLYIAEKNLARGLTIFVLGNGTLKEKISAEQASWNGSTWVLSTIRRYAVETGLVTNSETMPYDNLESPDLFTEDLKGTDEMGIAELFRYMTRLRNAGFRNAKLAVNLNAKISFPFINFFMMLLGMSLALRLRMGGGVISAGLGLLISLLYWLGYTFTLSLGYAGIVPAAVAAWTIPAVFSVASTVLFMQIPE